MTGRTTRRMLSVGGLLVLCTVVLCSAGITLRVYDNGGTSDDDLARVWIDGQSLGAITYHDGGTNQRTWDLGIPSIGTHSLVIEFTEDVDADDLCDEHVGTFGIEFGGGGLAASDDSASVNRGSSVDIDVLANDVYVEAGSTATDDIPCPSVGPAPTQSCSCTVSRTTYQTSFQVSGGSITIDGIVSPPSKGTAQIVGNEIRYTPDPDGCGTDSFVYEVDGPSWSSDTATVGVTIGLSPPTADDDSAETSEGEAVVIDVLDNDADAAGAALSIDGVGTPAHGTAAIVGTTIRYTPQPRYEGLDRFTYTVRDVCGATTNASVEVRVLHTNHPPIAHAGGFYQGFVGEPLDLDASFSIDPDIGDTLQFRWDLDDDGRFDTDWSISPTYPATYTAPYVGLVAVEVRDVYRGQLTGNSAQATALARIEQRPPELHGVLYVDLDGDGERDSDEPPLPQIPLVLDGETLVNTDEQGLAAFANLDSGEHTIAITAEGLALLRLQGFGVEESLLTFDVQPGEPTVALFPSQQVVGSLIGLVYVDSDGSGEQELDEPGVPGLRVLLDDKTERTTDDEGRFLFMNVLAGDYVLVIESEQHRWEGQVRIDAGEEIERIVVWPSPDSGFLELKIERGEPDEEGGE